MVRARSSGSVVMYKRIGLGRLICPFDVMVAQLSESSDLNEPPPSLLRPPR